MLAVLFSGKDILAQASAARTTAGRAVPLARLLAYIVQGRSSGLKTSWHALIQLNSSKYGRLHEH